VSWLLGLIRGLGGLRELIVQLFSATRNVSANVRLKKKDRGVDDAIAAALDEQLHDGDAEQQREAD
jgi:hypothetical protein